jgi:hypothetical protein
MFYNTPVQPFKETARHKRLQLLALLRACFAINPLLTLLGVLMCFTLLGTAIGIIVDHRVITGMPAWVKPTKFAISVGIYSFTFLWLLTFVQGHRHLVKGVTNVIAVGLFLEMVVIIMQVIRGTTSHFNLSTPFDTGAYFLMGGAIAIITMLNAVVAIVLLFQHMPDPVFAWSLRLGLLLFVIGACVGFLMVFPTPAQMAAIQAGVPRTIIGAHSVGVADGGPGLPFLGWSTTGGDLRIPHFVGLHALQVFPLFGWWIARLRSSILCSGHRVALVWTATLSYLGLVGLLTWQALRAQPLIAPDALTLQALASLLSATALAVILIIAHARAHEVQKHIEQ